VIHPRASVAKAEFASLEKELLRTLPPAASATET
jgi:hypothetical protein